jgi:hypothetical protein
MWTKTAKNGKLTCKEKLVSELLDVDYNFFWFLYVIILTLSNFIVLTYIKVLGLFNCVYFLPTPKSKFVGFWFSKIGSSRMIFETLETTTSGVPRNFFRRGRRGFTPGFFSEEGVQQIQLRTGGGENRDLGVLAP